jgi:type 1 fimbriae regulatory protein FimB/type 1 fimbriae regulatory protein FimE
VREHLTEDEVNRLLAALKSNRYGQRDWLIGLLIYRHGLRVSEACDLRWDDINLAKRTIQVRRLKGSDGSAHYLERDEVAGLKRLQREQEPKSAYVFVNERGQPFGRMGIGRMIERAGEVAALPFPIHAHMLRHSTGYTLAGKGMDTRRLQHFLGHASTHQHGALYRDVPGTIQGHLALSATTTQPCLGICGPPRRFRTVHDAHAQVRSRRHPTDHPKAVVGRGPLSARLVLTGAYVSHPLIGTNRKSPSNA